jgi:phage terminase small subunit
MTKNPFNKGFPSEEPVKTLTFKQERFVSEYMRHGNGARAAVAAGYSRHTARAIASENLRKPSIAAEIARRQAKHQKADVANIERVKRTLAKVAFSNIAGIFGPNGEIRPPREWPAEAWAGIESVQYSEKTAKDKDGTVRRVGYKARIKARDKLEALDQLAQILGMYQGK